MLTRYLNKKIKIEPYEQCPCGSDQKFKFCCYQKAREARHNRKDYTSYSDSRINHIINQNWMEADFKICLGFDKEKCTDEIKNAHSVQNNRILNLISEKGHLYEISSEITRKGPIPLFKKISRNKASTFFGFCDYHDTELFKPIELYDYNEEPIQDFLFAFRGAALEYHRKQRALNLHRKIFKEHPASLLDERSIRMYRTAQLDVSDWKQDYDLFKRDYMSNDFSNIKTVFRQLDYEVNFTACSAFAIQYDLVGKQINDIHGDFESEKMPSIFINVYPVEGATNILITYHKQDEATYKNYLTQVGLLDEDRLKEYLNYLIIEYTENIFFSPKMIEAMHEREKESILRSFTSSINIMEKIDLVSKQQYYNFNIFEKRTH